MDMGVVYLLVGVIIVLAFLYWIYSFLKKTSEQEKTEKKSGKKWAAK